MGRFGENWFSTKKWGVEHLVFAAASAATVAGGVLGNEKLQNVAKPLIAPALAVRVLRRARHTDRADTALLVAGLAAATVGDVFMIDPDDDDRIVRGASSFGLMQALYSAVLTRHGARLTGTALAQRLPAVFGAAGLLGTTSGPVAVPLTAYGSLLATTGTLAADPALAPGARTVAEMPLPNADRRSWLALGGLVFTASDGTIVVRRSLLKNEKTRAAAEGFILATYATAQVLLVEGMLALVRRR